MRTYNETIKFLAQLEKDNNIDLRDSLANYVREQDFEDFDQTNAFDSLRDLIEDAGGFNIEVIYYANAIKYLAENDQSLMESIELAAEMGFEVSSINSELLASLLRSQIERDKFEELSAEVEEFFTPYI